MSNSNFLPGPIPSFINFNNYSVKNAYNESLSAVDANDIDTSFFTMIKSNIPKGISPSSSILFDVDSNNALTLQQINCMYPTNPNAPGKSILAYKINTNNPTFRSVVQDFGTNNNQCMTEPSQAYSPSYMPNCMSVCNRISNTPTSSINYTCNNDNNNNSSSNNNGGLPLVMYIPRGGWMSAGIDKESLLKDMANTPSGLNIINSIAPLSSNKINVTTSTGEPIYIANNNSTSDLNTWTKLEDLCQ